MEFEVKNRRNYYRVLQVQPDAPVEVIKATYKTLMRDLKQHPDLGGDVWNAQVLNEAYETLNQADKRHLYDKKLFERYTKKPFANPLTGQKPVISVFCPFCKRPLARKASPGQSCPTCKSPLQSQADDELSRTCRRAVGRIKKGGRFYYYTTWPQKALKGELADISKNGMRFRTNVTLSKGLLIKLNGPLVSGVAKISNVQKMHGSQNKMYSIGTEFVSVIFKEPRGGFYSKSA